MPGFRHQRLVQSVHELLSHCLYRREVKDPRLHSINIIRVELAKDFVTAVVFVCTKGGEAPSEATMKVLQHSAGFFQSYIASHIRMRNIPKLRFVTDDGLRKSADMWKLLEDL